MIIRVLNDKQEKDKFYDCRNSCIRKSTPTDREEEEVLLDLEFNTSEPITVVLAPGDAIYYMNNAGATVHADRRMLTR